MESKRLGNFKDFDSNLTKNETFFSRENEEEIENDNAFSTSGKTSEETEEVINLEEEEAFEEGDNDEGQNAITDDNTGMEDANDDAIDDEIQQDAEIIGTQEPGGFNPNFSRTPQEWSVVKFMTDAGIRLGMDYSNSVDQGVEVMGANLDYEACCAELDKLSNDLGIDQHDSGLETYIGSMNKSIINKPEQKTSYGDGMDNKLDLAV